MKEDKIIYNNHRVEEILKVSTIEEQGIHLESLNSEEIEIKLKQTI